MEILQKCKLSHGEIWLNESLIYHSDLENFVEFTADAYRNLKINYPKFFKMDKLCKLAILGSSLILDSFQTTDKESVALVFANSSSCIDIDLKHQETIANTEAFYPSPANFVYTLPNIAIGEVSIKYQLQTESAFFISDNFDYAFLERYAALLIEQNRVSHVLIAWIEVNGNDYVGNFFLVSQSN